MVAQFFSKGVRLSQKVKILLSRYFAADQSREYVIIGINRLFVNKGEQKELAKTLLDSIHIIVQLIADSSN